ncbi:MAG: hypothetical protein CL578_11345 [Alteromonadaceae bacterium]|uniref:DUF2254 domain-containing protein n=1 Tax=Paraglaciecola chathamensis TaxID=368405 RepID=UPI000C669FAB|nr:DUF2254 domain-containing protein [Paraglaciecola agarilytica]MBN25628.1 hypothetical protein [Alteromonadaceae bacterium]|tara:strand:+ start:72851 stop:74185 length:1335 start_codon:yes stop_codon:yes gene_type:complete
MNTRIITLWETIRTSFWFVPSIMALLAIVSSQLGLAFDRFGADSELKILAGFYETSPESARALLTTIATAMITVTSIAFSITVVALSLASSQFGPRLIRNFMMDTGTQCVLGFFLSTFIYCLLIIQATKSFEQQSFVPGFSILTSVLLAILGVGVLIYFIHHVARAIQADNVIDNVYCELNEIIERLFPKDDEQHTAQSDTDVDLQTPNFSQVYPNQQEIHSLNSGYVQTLDLAQLQSLAKETDMAFHMYVMPGDFVVKGTVLGAAYFHQPKLGCATHKITDLVRLGAHRTPVQDAEFAIRQLVEIAVRALSPGINDPYTAVTVVDKLSAVLCDLTAKTFPPQTYEDEEGVIRLQCKPVEYAGLGEAAFNQIRQYSKDSLAVTIRLLEGLSSILSFSQAAEHRQFVRQQAQMIEQIQSESLLGQQDWQDIKKRLDDIKRHLEND